MYATNSIDDLDWELCDEVLFGSNHAEKSYGDGQELCVVFAALFSHRASEPIKFSLAEKESLV